MAIIDVVKCDGNLTDLIWKSPISDLRLGTQLIVRTGQVAFFVKGGIIYDEFSEGTYTLHSGNIPLLNKMINLPFEGNSPFQAELWFINTLVKLDNKWGTPNAMLLEDADYHIVVPVRAFGQFGLKVSSPRVFFTSLIGTLKSFTNSDITSYFAGAVITRVSDSIAEKLALGKISVLKIPAHLLEISDFVTGHLQGHFDKFGIELVNFFIMSINMPQNDSSVIALKAATEKQMLIQTVGKDIYSFDRSMDVLEKAAANEGNSGSLMGAAMGLGMGMGIGPALGKQMGQLGLQMQSPSTLNSLPMPIQPYYVHQNSQQYGPLSLEMIQSYIQQGAITANTYLWKPGLTDWLPANSLPEISVLFGTARQVPPPAPKDLG
ncbi:MAG: SPFH domain-containing protein [Candidatus Cloacimonetes bacterium]|jgi:membrane protease subunit (stomatin/prohibitin family)|nr:SPFH domain-containing protein [Candidatus Cloacimonadota bacterium]MDY0228581.1 SPFH domain-containing protein [Candidatus Cloacimonadaceae bacterium]